MEIQESNFTHVGMDILQKKDSSIAITQKTFRGDLQLLQTSADLRGQRQRPLDPSDIHDRQCVLGELCWLATTSRQDICPRLAVVHQLAVYHVYRISDLIRTAEQWQDRMALALK